MLEEELWAGKTNPDLDHVSLIVRMNLYTDTMQPALMLTQQHTTRFVFLPTDLSLPEPPRAFPACLETAANSPMNFSASQWLPAHILQ